MVTKQKVREKKMSNLICSAYSRAACISPLQFASGILWTAFAVASPSAIAALIQEKEPPEVVNAVLAIWGDTPTVDVVLPEDIE